MNILINGLLGYMGKEVERLCRDCYLGACLAYGVDPLLERNEEKGFFSSLYDIPDTSKIDCIVDFSHHLGTDALLRFATSNKLPLVIATTGHTNDEARAITLASGDIPIFCSANMSFGTAYLAELSKKVARVFPDAEIEIIEKHHNRKYDSPSGSALMLFEAIREVRPESYAVYGRCGRDKRKRDEIGIHSIRMGNTVGEHEVIIGNDYETFTLRHTVHSRALFAKGALLAAKFLTKSKAGLYGMQSLIS